MAKLKTLAQLLQKLQEEGIDPTDVAIHPSGIWVRPDADVFETDDEEED